MQEFRETPWQFGIRHLLVAMFFIATASGLLAPWLRNWSAAQWLQLVLQMLMTAGSFAIVIGLHGHARQQMLDRVGSKRWETRALVQNRGLGRYWRGYQLMATSILLLFGIAAINSASEEPLLDMGPGLAAALPLGILAGIGACELRFPGDRLVVGDKGVAFANRAILWDDVSLEPPAPRGPSCWALTTLPDGLYLEIDDENGRAMADLRRSALSERGENLDAEGSE